MGHSYRFLWLFDITLICPNRLYFPVFQGTPESRVWGKGVKVVYVGSELGSEIWRGRAQARIQSWVSAARDWGCTTGILGHCRGCWSELPPGEEGEGVCSSVLPLAEGHPPGVESPAGVWGLVRSWASPDSGRCLGERCCEVGLDRALRSCWWCVCSPPQGHRRPWGLVPECPTWATSVQLKKKIRSKDKNCS